MPPLGFLVATAFVLGAAISGTSFTWSVIAVLAGLFAILAMLLNDRRWLVYGGLVLVAIAGGTARVADEEAYPSAPGGLSGSDVFTGQVTSVPRAYPAITYATFEVREPEAARLWAELPPYPRVRQGDIITVDGSFRSFDEAPFRGFAAQRGTHGVLTAGRVQVIESRATAPERFRNVVSDEVRERIQQRIPEPAAAFTVGMLLGDDGAMTEATRHNFRVGGMTHMTAVSGLHVGILAGGVLLLARLGLVHRWWLLGVSLPLIWTFAYVVGMRPSVVRASLMFTLLVIAIFLGRPRDTINAVAMASALMILVDPAIRFDLGFQLSVAATTGIALGILLIGDHSPWHVVWVVPIAAEVAVEPLILHHFGYYSLVSPLANIVAAPFVAIAMPLGILTVAASFLSTFLADVIAIAAWVPARSVVLIADTSARVPLLSGEIEPLAANGVLMAYVVLAGLVAVLFVVLHPSLGDHEGDVGTVYRI